MDRIKGLLEGLVRFQEEVFPRHRELYKSLASQQHPEVLMLACSDSRIVTSSFLQAQPGDLFVCRNAGNLAPPHGESSSGVAATIEYAVQVLQVKHIVVCGHTDCGAMKAVMHPEKVSHLPAVANWLRHAERAAAVVNELYPDVDQHGRLRMLVRENVIAQMANLMTYPSVAAKVRARALEMHGWVFDIEKGRFEILDATTQTFTTLEFAAPVSEANSRA
jgi:carbonic anhydrase